MSCCFGLLQFAGFVTTKCKSRITVFTLGINAHIPSKSFGYVGQPLNRGWPKEERLPGDRCKRLRQQHSGHILLDDDDLSHRLMSSFIVIIPFVNRGYNRADSSR